MKGGKSSEYIKVRFYKGLTVPGDRALFMLSITVGEDLSTTGTKARERKRLLVQQYCTIRGMYDQRWGTI